MTILNLIPANQALNLHKAFCLATNDPVKSFSEFNWQYPKCATKENNHDCGFCVIRLLECHNGSDLTGYGTKRMDIYMQEVAHILVHHEYNDYHPSRFLPKRMNKKSDTNV
uniref:Uncharacterized protein n=1 Tax=Avena sativa TaxID=4498 RepID=A0ACD5XGK8_AVESA